VAVLVLAVLYMAMLQLLLLESSEKLRGAVRFRARIEADILAEEAIELASEGMIDSSSGRTVNRAVDSGKLEGSFEQLQGNRFRLAGRGQQTGPVASSASVVFEGRIRGTSIVIDRSEYGRKWD